MFSYIIDEDDETGDEIPPLTGMPGNSYIFLNIQCKFFMEPGLRSNKIIPLKDIFTKISLRGISLKSSLGLRSNILS